MASRYRDPCTGPRWRSRWRGFFCHSKFGSTRIRERFTLRPHAARLPRLALQSFRRKAKPTNSKARQRRAVQSGVNREFRVVANRLSPKTRSNASEKYIFANGLFCAEFRPSPGGWQADRSWTRPNKLPRVRVSATFRREFKTYAAAHDLKLNELLVKCFESYRKQQGD